jgi:hypothetical protein
MAIIVSKGGHDARRIEPMPIAQEDYLQQYIHENPEAIPVTELKDDAKLLILAREFPTNSGPIDALGVDSDGDVYIVETKLYKNPDKRLVIAQMLDYGAALWKGHHDFSTFTAQVEATGGSRLKTGLTRTLADFFGLDDQATDAVLENMRRSLSEGRFQFIVLMDQLEDRLRTLISFVNANSNFRVLGCELEFYQHDGFEILIPRLYGAEVRSVVASSSTKRSNLTMEAAHQIADANGVGPIFRTAVSICQKVFQRRGSTKTAITFAGSLPSENQVGTILSLFPEKSSVSKGLAYAVYIHRFAEFFGVPEARLRELLPQFDADPDDPKWVQWPHEGFLASEAEMNRVLNPTGKKEES